MPTYEYRCPDGHDFEKFVQKISLASSELPCPVCGKIAQRRISAGGGLVFKGSGFYITDYGKDGKKDLRANAAAASSSDKQSSGTSGESGAGPSSDSSKGESSKGDSSKSDSSKSDSPKSDSSKSDSSKSESSKSDSAKSDSSRSSSSNSEKSKSDKLAVAPAAPKSSGSDK
jgi:putative FmdB family regulatory protein